MTQQQLAEATGLSTMTIRRYESRNRAVQRIPGIADCQRIAAVLGLQWWELAGLEADGHGSGVYVHEMAPDQAQKWNDRLSKEHGKEGKESELVRLFSMLNDVGKGEALKRISELAELSRYRKN